MSAKRKRPSPPPNTAVIYARFSCSKQREASIDDQLRVCARWCADSGREVVGTYCDHAVSGRTDDRPEFQRMIANAGEAECVVVYMMDRFSRDVYDAPIYKKRLRDLGVSVVSATEPMPDGPEALLMESIYEALAAMESAHTSRRVIRGMEGNALACRHNGVRVYGYRWAEDGTYEVDEAEAAVVREVFERRIAGESANSIARDLASRGVRTSHGRPCTHSMVHSMLGSEKYVGVYSWGKTRVEGGMPAIVTREEFEMAQRARARKVRSTEDWGEYAFAGRGVCMECGSNLVGVSGRGRHDVKYQYYRCSRRCGCPPIRADVVESSVVRELRSMLSSRETAREIAETVVSNVSDGMAGMRLREAAESLSAAQRGISNIMRAVEEGMPYSEVRERMDELCAQRARAEANVELWSRRSEVDVDELAGFLSSADGMTDSELLDAFVWQVQLGEEVVVAVLSYAKSGEPARMEFRRGFEDVKSGRPHMTLCEPWRGVVAGRVVVMFRRAA